jgi:hypothetical protein
MGKDNYLHGKCPVEVYGAEIAVEVLPRIYNGQEECSCAHGCVRADCLLDGSWTEEGETTPASDEPAQRQVAPADPDPELIGSA